MGLEMNGSTTGKWLTGRRARIVGHAPDIAQALAAHDALLFADRPCDILVHVAASPVPKPVHELSHAEWRHTLDRGLDQRFFEAKAFPEALRGTGHGGSILFVGAPEQSLGSDHAAAGALGNLVKSLSVEWARDGVRVNAILSGNEGKTHGNLAAYLVSEYAAYVTGAVMGIDCDDG